MSDENQEIRVLIADDHTVVRRGLATLLSDPKYGIRVVGEAGDGQSAVDKARELQPDVILMDLFMPVLNGIEATRLIHEADAQVRILMLTSSGDEDQVIQALRAGASGYLLKDASPDELVNALRSVFYGQLALPHELAQRVILASAAGTPDPDKDPLTERERQVLACIEQGMSNKQIARQLAISTTTVRTHVSNVLRKLGLENRTQLALYARDHKP
jgi:DNA-binding NarL/FixJ family response regulator